MSSVSIVCIYHLISIERWRERDLLVFEPLQLERKSSKNQMYTSRQSRIHSPVIPPAAEVSQPSKMHCWRTRTFLQILTETSCLRQRTRSWTPPSFTQMHLSAWTTISSTWTTVRAYLTYLMPTTSLSCENVNIIGGDWGQRRMNYGSL